MGENAKEQIIVDIFLMLGGKSGLEAVVNRVAVYLAVNGCRVRIIQVIKTDVEWATKKASFFCFDMNSDVNIQKCKQSYLEYIKGSASPNVVFATGLPIMTYLAKLTLSELTDIQCPVIAWPHNDISYYDSDMDNTKSFWQFADFFYAISDKIASDISKLFPQKIIYRVNNPVDIDKIVYSEERATNKIAYVGRLAREKNIPLILEAVSKCKSKWKLSIVGEGEEKKTIREVAEKYGMCENIEFFGWVDNPWIILKNHRALIMSSHTAFEGSPLTCIEALASGMPVISTPVATIPEIIDPGKNGYIYDFDDSDALANILDKLSETEFTKEVSRNCRESVKDYIPEVALWDFLCKTVASAELIGLPQRFWEDKENRLVRR